MPYTDIAGSESYGSVGHVAIKVCVDLSRELTKEEKDACRSFVYNMHQTLIRGSMLVQEDTQTWIRTQRQGILGCFPDAIFVEEVPNEYDSQAVQPWYQITTKVGRIKVGWRKRVMDINWAGSLIQVDAQSLFPDWKHTIYETGLHCWTYDELRVVVAKLMEQEHE